MNIIDTFFSDIIFFKIKKERQYDVYCARIHDRLAGNKHKYIFVFVPFSELNPEKADIKDLDWASIQTRILEFDHQLPPQLWSPPCSVNPIISLIKRSKNETLYKSQALNGILITLLKDKKKKGDFQYNSSMSLSTALETGFCVITLD